MQKSYPARLQLILLFAVIIGLTKSYAQDHYGIKGGLNFAKEKSKTTSEINSIVAYNLGVFYSKTISDKLALQPELVLSLEGGKIPQFVNAGYDYNYHKFTYLNLPICAKYTFSKDLNIIKNVDVYAGPQLGFLLHSKFETNGQTQTNWAGMAKLNVSLALGAGYRVTEKFETTIRYNIGLTNLTNDSQATSAGVKNYTRTWQVGVAYRIK